MTLDEAIKILKSTMLDDEDCGEETCEDCQFNRAAKKILESIPRKPKAWMYVNENGLFRFRLHRWRNTDGWKEIPLAEIPEGGLAEHN